MPKATEAVSFMFFDDCCVHRVCAMVSNADAWWLVKKKNPRQLSGVLLVFRIMHYLKLISLAFCVSRRGQLNR